MKRNMYLKSTDLKDISPILELITRNHYIKEEIISVVDCLNRISFQCIYAKVSSPFYNASAMDGIVLKASSTYGASETTPVILNKDDFSYINTGNEIPENYDAVVN